MIYTTDTHLAVEDTELFIHDVKPKTAWLRRASSDVARDVLKQGLDASCLLDARAKTQLTLTVSAQGGDVTYTAGTFVEDSCSGRKYEVENTLVVLDGNTGELELVADVFGEPHNDFDVLDLEALEFATLSDITMVTKGADHQLTLAATYRAMELIYLNYTREEDDCFDAKRRIYRELARGEVKRVMAAGVIIDHDQDGVADHSGVRFTVRRLERG